MPHQATSFQLPCGARACRLEISGALSGEEAKGLIQELDVGGAFHDLPRLFVLRKLGSIPQETRTFIGQRGPAGVEKWEAVVVTNPVIRVTASFIIRAHQRKKTKLFSSEEDALQWLDARAREDQG